MIRTQVQLDENQYAYLKEMARAEKVSISALVRRSVDLIINQIHRPSESDRRKNALSALGRFSDHATDVAENHDQYLAEAFDL